jgi:hypothetical protein
MAFDGEMYRISIAEAHALPEQQFRDLFIEAIDELVGDSGIRALGIRFLNEGRSPRDLSTTEMRQVVLAHQNLLNPLPTKEPVHRLVLTIETAREILNVGAEYVLKKVFCETVHALNDWRGARSPLPAVPERCSTQEILDLLEGHPHWFVPASAAAE